jgi:hypothetical protein
MIASPFVSEHRMRKLEKPTARGPSPRKKAERALGQKLNRKSKPPPDPSALFREDKIPVHETKPI